MPRPCCGRRRWNIAQPNSGGACCFGSKVRVKPEKAVVANCFGRARMGLQRHELRLQPGPRPHRGEFGHNDFYPVAVAAAQHGRLGRRAALRGDVGDRRNSRPAGRSVFAQNVQDRSRACTARLPRRPCYGAMLGATVDQIESAIGLVVAHYIPFRAIRDGKQLSDSKGASAAISAEVAVLEHAARDARFRRPGRYLSQSRGDLLPVRKAGRSAAPARSIWRWPPAAMISP